MANSIAIGVAYQDQAISGGTIDNSVIGGTTAAAGTFTNLTASNNLAVKAASVAATGTDNTNAAALAGGFSLVTAADGTKGVILPDSPAGTIIIVKNSDAANAILKVYPDAGAAINALTATTGAFSMAAKTSCIFVASSTTQWYSIPLVAS